MFTRSAIMTVKAPVSRTFLFGEMTSIVSMMLVMVITFDQSLAQCPLQCSCVPYRTGKASSCGPGLSSIPKNLPGDTKVFSLSALPTQPKNSVPLLTQKDFAAIVQVERIQIAFSNVQRIEANAFVQLSKLAMLDLKGNKLTHLSRPVFRGLDQLKLLDLTDNRGCQIDSDTFDDLASLTTLRLAGIGLTNMGDLLSKLNSLTSCDLHGNKLVRLDSGSFVHLSNLQHLDVAFNNLREIQPGMKTILSGLSSFKVESNPWRCNCAMIWMKSLPARFIHPSSRGGGGVICEQPTKSQYRDLRNVKDADMTCMPARIDSCSRVVSVLDGQPATLTCKVVGDPIPDVVWTTPTSKQFLHTLQANVSSQSTVSLPFSKFDDHNGDWKIHVYNANGSDTRTVKLDVLTTTTITTTTTTTTTTSTSTASAKKMTMTSHPRLSSTSVSSSPDSTRPNSITTNRPSPHSDPQHTLTSLPTRTLNQSSSSTTQSTSLPSSVNIVLVVAACAGAIVCITGIAVLSMVISKTKRKSRISAKRKSVYSISGDLQMFNRNPNKVTGSFHFHH